MDPRSGQAAVESALTLPMTVFLILGTIQWFGMLQARIMSQYAAARAARAGSLNYGTCDSMTQAAIAALLPSIHPFLQGRSAPSTEYGAELAAHLGNKFVPASDDGHDETIVWILREGRTFNDATQPGLVEADGVFGTEDLFDLPWDPSGATPGLQQQPLLLEVRLVFWYPMNIPFANWVMSYMALAKFGLQSYDAQNPLMPVQADAAWRQAGQAPPSYTVEQDAVNVLQTLIQRKQYSFPIMVTSVTRMMTPPRKQDFGYSANDCRPPNWAP